MGACLTLRSGLLMPQLGLGTRLLKGPELREAFGGGSTASASEPGHRDEVYSRLKLPVFFPLRLCFLAG